MDLNYLEHMRSYYAELLITTGIEYLRQNPGANPESFVNDFLPPKNEIVDALKNYSTHKSAKKRNKSELQAELNETLNRIESNLSSIRGARIMCMHNKKMEKNAQSSGIHKNTPKSTEKNSKGDTKDDAIYFHCSYNNQGMKDKKSDQPEVLVYHPAHWLTAQLVSKK